MENYPEMEMESDEYITKYPTPDKQYAGAMKYSTYESLQTGAGGKK